MPGASCEAIKYILLKCGCVGEVRDQYLEVLFLFIESAAQTHDLHVLNCISCKDLA